MCIIHFAGKTGSSLT